MFFLVLDTISTMQDVQGWLNQLAEELKLEEALVLDDKNQCFLMFDENMLVEMEFRTNERTFSFKGNLGNVNEAKVKKIYPKLLEANAQWQETNGATFGLQQYSEKVLLTQSILTESCDYHLFYKALEYFVNTFEYWIKRLKELQESSSQQENPVFSGMRI